MKSTPLCEEISVLRLYQDILALQEKENLSVEPTIDGAPSAQKQTQSVQERPLVSKYDDKILNKSIPLFVSGSSLQHRKS